MLRLLTVALLSFSALAQVPPQRTDTGWLRPNAYGETLRSYPINLRAPPSECAQLVVHAQLSYRYNGSVFVHPMAPVDAYAFGQGTCIYWIGHQREATFSDAFYGVSAGGGGWYSWAPPGGTNLIQSTTVFTADVSVPPQAMASTPFEIATGQRNGVPMHRVWFTPQFFDDSSWGWGAPLPPNSPWEHVPIVWQYEVEVRMEAVWEWI